MLKIRPRTYFHISLAFSLIAVAIAISALWASITGKTIDTSHFFGTLPNWITAIIALFALIAAGVSIQTQREVARKRAALDFFVKTEMDKEILDAHTRYTNSVAILVAWVAQTRAIDDFVKTQDHDYRNIRAYLNLHELMAVGISRDVLDDNVCYYFWSGELLICYRDTRALIEYIQTLPDESGTYCEMQRVAERWSRKASL